MARYFKVILKITDGEEVVEENGLESAIEDTLEYLPYDLVGTVQEIEETDEN